MRFYSSFNSFERTLDPRKPRIPSVLPKMALSGRIWPRGGVNGVLTLMAAAPVRASFTQTIIHEKDSCVICSNAIANSTQPKK